MLRSWSLILGGEHEFHVSTFIAQVSVPYVNTPGLERNRVF